MERMHKSFWEAGEGELRIDAAKLGKLIKNDKNYEQLTVCKMALRDIADGKLKSAVARLSVDLDKLMARNPELSDYVKSIMFPKK